MISFSSFFSKNADKLFKAWNLLWYRLLTTKNWCENVQKRKSTVQKQQSYAYYSSKLPVLPPMFLGWCRIAFKKNLWITSKYTIYTADLQKNSLALNEGKEWGYRKRLSNIGILAVSPRLSHTAHTGPKGPSKVSELSIESYLPHHNDFEPECPIPCFG